MIFLFMAGGPSHLETFDPKPLLNKLDGQPRPKEFGEAKYQFIQSNAKLLGTKRTFRKYGQSGIEVSDLFPETAGSASTTWRSSARATATWSSTRPRSMSCSPAGSCRASRAWARGSSTGSGRRASRCPAYVVMPDPNGALEAGQPMYMQRLPAGRLPADDVPPRRPAGAQPRPAGGCRSRTSGGGRSS